jgi:hypothetical protein
MCYCIGFVDIQQFAITDITNYFPDILRAVLIAVWEYARSEQEKFEFGA